MSLDLIRINPKKWGKEKRIFIGDFYQKNQNQNLVQLCYDEEMTLRGSDAIAIAPVTFHVQVR